MRPVYIVAAQPIKKIEVGERERAIVEQTLMDHCEDVSYSLAVDLIKRDEVSEAIMQEQLEEMHDGYRIFVMWWDTNGIYDESGQVLIDRSITVPDNREL